MKRKGSRKKGATGAGPRARSSPRGSARKKSGKKQSPDRAPDRRGKSGGSSSADAGKAQRVSGLFEGHPRGFGFVRPDKQGEPDVFVPAPYVGSALHGDRVEVRFHRSGREGRSWGEVIKVLERSPKPVIGFFNGRLVVPRDPRVSAWLQVHPADAGDAEPGDIVVAAITRRGPRGVHGRIIEVLGKQDSPGIESRVVLAGHGFNEAFPAEALEEAVAAPAGVTESDRAGREDLRGLFTITIDPESARDYDDALSIEKTPGGYRLWVSIADVSHYVASGSALDLEAYERATSVYFPDRSIPMLPPELSSGICSLKPGVERLAVTVEMELDRGGRRTRARTCNSVIKSNHRLSYDRVEEMERDPSIRSEFPGAWEAVEVMRELAGLRRKRRMGRGAIDLDMPEAEVVLDDSGEVVTILRREQTWSHQLVEEFMLAANETVASMLTDMDVSMVYRIHEQPAPQAVTALADMLAPLGFRLLEKNVDLETIRPRDYQRMIEQSRGTPFELVVKTLCLRSMMQARYSPRLIGHFGLASDRYCHFTSPIRRYPDLIVHRLLKKAMAEDSKRHVPTGKPAPENLAAASIHCSERERAAEDAEHEMVDLYSVLWMARHLGNEFVGTVTGVTPFGMFVELSEVYIEGMVPADTMDREVEFIEREMLIRLKTRKEEYRIGDKVRVWSESVDRDRRRVTLGLIGKVGRV